MSEPHSDALVFFGATGDLAYKKIFPALQGMVRRGHLRVPVIGVARAGWGLDQFKARARDDVEKHSGLDPAAFARLSSLLRYVDGDYQDPATFAAMRKALGPAQHPAHYLAIHAYPCCRMACHDCGNRAWLRLVVGCLSPPRRARHRRVAHALRTGHEYFIRREFCPRLFRADRGRRRPSACDD